jgi:phage tail sheath protein FI
MGSLITGSGAPGVTAVVNTGFLGMPSQPESSDAFFVAGYLTWGPVNQARSITGLSGFTRQFGGLHPNSHAANAIHHFFQKGGQRAVVCRVVGDDAAVGTLTINDRAGVPVATIRIDAKYPSSVVDVRVTIEAGDEANTVKITARSVKLAGSIPREVFNNVKLTFTENELDAINTGSSKLTTLQFINDKSNLIRVTNLNSATVAPGNLPAMTAETVLAGGDDDFAGLTDASFIGTDDGDTKTGLQVFNSEDEGTGQVALPGVTTQAAHAALLAHAEAFKRFALLDLPFGTDKDAAVTARRLLGSPYGAIYWPWIQQLDFEGTGTKKYYPPSGAVAGIFARAEFEEGIHKAPANYTLANVLDVERASNGSPQTDANTRALMNRNEINVITPLSEQGVKVYGARVLASFGRVTAVHQQRILNQIYYRLKKSYQSMPFAVLDAEGKLFREARSISEDYLRTLYRSGALTSTNGKEDGAFIVRCDLGNNPPETLDQNQLNVEVTVHLVGMAESITIKIDSVPLATSLGELAA